MEKIKISKKTVLNNTQLKLFKEKAEKLIKLEIIQSIAAKEEPGTYKYNFAKRKNRGKTFDSTGNVFANQFSKLSSADRSKKYSLFKSNQFADSELKNEVSVMKADLKSKTSVLEQIDLKKEFSFLTQNQITKENLINMFSTNGIKTSSSSAKTVIAKTKISKVKFNLNEVKCIDATDPEKTLWVTNYDEISMGGVTISDTGEEKKISAFSVGNKFKDGTNKKYESKTLRTFTPDTAYSDSKYFFVTLFLAEIDSGGFSDFISEAYEAIKDDLEVILSSLGIAAGAYIGAEIGGTVGASIGGPLGLAIGALAGLILGALVSWLVKALKDDIFEPSDEHQSIVIIPDAYSDFDGKDSYSDYMYFEDYDGKYRVKYTWEIERY